MSSTRHFSVQLLCVVSIFTTLTLNASPLRVALRRLYSTAESSATTITVPKERSVVSLNSVTIHQLDEIYKCTASTAIKVDALNSKNKLITFLSITALGQALYITNDKNPFGIATYVKGQIKAILPTTQEAAPVEKRAPAPGEIPTPIKK